MQKKLKYETQIRIKAFIYLFRNIPQTVSNKF